MLNTSTGIWTSSENAIAAECLEPSLSKIPGAARWAKKWGREVIVNAKAIADRSQVDSRFVHYFPSSELTRRWTNPGTAPGFVHEKITHRR